MGQRMLQGSPGRCCPGDTLRNGLWMERGDEGKIPQLSSKGSFCLAQRRSSAGRRSLHGNGAGNGFQMLGSSGEVGLAKGEQQHQML